MHILFVTEVADMIRKPLACRSFLTDMNEKPSEVVTMATMLPLLLLLDTYGTLFAQRYLSQRSSENV